MGKDLAERFPAAQEMFAAADEALGIPLSRLAWHGPESELTLTNNAQPAILVHSLAVFAVVRAALQPCVAAGHSLGEYTAYATAGALKVADAVRLVRRRGELMLEAGKQRPGTMAAVIGLDPQKVQEICEADSGGGRVVVAANFNAPDQTVVSGDPDAVEQAGEHFKQAGAKRVLPLKVSGAFHSQLMMPAQVGLRQELEGVELTDPRFPVIANATAEPVTGADDARRLLGEQLTSPVRWVASMERAAGVAGEGTTFVEIGPGAVLAGLLKRIVVGSTAVSLGTADQVTEFLERRG
jgi:[acyl-carrier-protein] S-malonyltransferase